MRNTSAKKKGEDPPGAKSVCVCGACEDCWVSGTFRLHTKIYEEPDKGEILEMPISVLKLPTRAMNALQKKGIGTVKDLAMQTMEKLIGIPQIGTTNAHLIKARLNEFVRQARLEASN